MIANLEIPTDKSGDVYLFPRNADEGRLLLGHLSMLLSVEVAGRKIATGDRDEKIRISCFPNAYSIHGFCLGHKEFVTTVAFLPLNEKVLVSASGTLTGMIAVNTMTKYSFVPGDGCLKAWCVETCREISTHSCHCDVDLVQPFGTGDTPSNGKTIHAIKSFQIFSVGSKTLIAALIHG